MASLRYKMTTAALLRDICCTFKSSIADAFIFPIFRMTQRFGSSPRKWKMGRVILFAKFSASPPAPLADRSFRLQPRAAHGAATAAPGLRPRSRKRNRQ